METRQQWGTRAGFIFAAIGSAVRLQEIYGVFLIQRTENGGGAFFLPYLFALLTTGISLLAFRVCSWSSSSWFGTTYIFPY